MLSNKPYLIRAFYQWITDNGCTPFLVLNANFPRCRVPLEHVEKGEITLNISSLAIRDLKLGNDMIEFQASFSGAVHYISAPVKAVLAIYAQENQEGMFFDYEEAGDGDSAPIEPQANIRPDNSAEKKKSHLQLVE